MALIPINSGVTKTLNSLGGAIEINGLSAPPAVTPVANFTSSTTTPTQGDAIYFYDTSTNSPTSWSWSFSQTPTYLSSTSSTSQNPVVSFANTGTVNVTLTATNSAGSDGETKNSYITVSASGVAPTAAFTISDDTPDVSQTVTFTDTSTGAPTSWLWAITGGAFTYVGGTSSTSQNPQVQFTDSSTSYTINLTATNSFGSDGATPDAVTTNAAGPPPVNLPTGYLMYYDFGNASCYSGSGSSVTDLGTAGANGTIVGSGYSHTSGSAGYMDVTAGSAYIEIPTNSNLQSAHTNNFTHIYVIKDVTSAGSILHNGNPTSFNDPSGTPEQYVWTLARNNISASTSSLSAGNQPDTTTAWRVIGVTKSGGTFKWYVDGTLTETDTVSSFNYTTYSQKWLIWRRPRDYTSALFGGKHAALLVYNSVLTAQDMSDAAGYFLNRY